MKRNDVYYLGLTGIFSAIIVLMTVVPQVGFITLAPLASVTLLHIPVLIGVFLMPRKYGALLGLVFGLASMIRSFIPTGPLDFAFQNPLVSVLPRILFALAASYIFDGLKWINAKFKYGDVITFGIVTSITLFGLYYAANALSNWVGWSMGWLAPVALLLGLIFVTLYFAFINKKDKTNVYLPSSLILGTLVHSLIVLSALGIFSTALIEGIFPDRSVIGTIFTIALTNGLIEAIFAAVIGTPILIALQNFRKQNA